MSAKVSIQEFSAQVGAETGVSDWLFISQDRITAFGGITLDFDPHHIEPSSARGGPFGVPTAQGFLTLSLLTHLVSTMTSSIAHLHHINYGLDQVRFVRPLAVETRIRARFTLTDARQKKPGETRLTFQVVVEGDDGDKPYMHATWLILLLEEGASPPLVA